MYMCVCVCVCACTTTEHAFNLHSQIYSVFLHMYVSGLSCVNNMWDGVSSHICIQLP